MKNYKYLLTTFFPLHILLVSLFFFVDYNFINLLYFLAGYIFIGGYGVAIGLHRWASHRSIILKSWAENLIIYASVLSCQGHPIWWAAVHRGYHHIVVDWEFGHLKCFILNVQSLWLLFSKAYSWIRKFGNNSYYPWRAKWVKW